MKHNELIEIIETQTNKKPRQKEIAEALGVDIGRVGKRASRNSEYTLDEIIKLSQYFKINFENYIDSSLFKSVKDDFLKIPVRGEVLASMGYGVTVYNENQTGVYEISRKLANDIGISSSSSEIIFATGDSMEPTIIGGDSLLIDLSKKEVYDGKIYCVRIDGQLYAKRLQKIPPHKIKVISDNKEKYDPFYVDFSKEIDFDFEIIGEIKWWGRIAR